MDFKTDKQSILSSLKEDMARLKQKGGALTLPIQIWNNNYGRPYMSFKGKKYYADSTQWYDIRKFRTLMDKVISEINAKNVDTSDFNKGDVKALREFINKTCR